MPSARDSYSSVMELPHSTPAEVAPSASDELWHIHGKVYDLTSFVKRHPGGPQVLMSVRGTDDLTAIFESSHAFADRRRVDATMSKYCLGRCAKSQLAFPEGGFYATVTKRVRAALTNGVHANRWWCLKAFILVAAWLSCLCVAFIAPPAAISGSGRCLAAAAAGHLFICHGFVIMHDASHSAVSSNHAINSALSWMWNACACWDARLWHKHHVFRHHSFTGDLQLDPDTIHFTPFLRKHVAGRQTAVLSLSRAAPRVAAVLFLHVLPGMFIGQAVSYARWWCRGRLWRMQALRHEPCDVAACVVRALVACLLLRHPLAAFAYVVSCNTTYAICILPDHDTEETRTSTATPSADWGEEQVRNSANFATSNPLVCALYGGINYQIEHHLFPTLSHVHYATIQPIVRQACAEFDIPYVDYPTISSAYCSALRAVATATLA